MLGCSRFVVSVLVFAACSLPPPADDVELGSRVAASMEADVGLCSDDALHRYVVAVGRHVADQVPAPQFEYRFAVLDQRAPNAFAAPGGFVYVSRGLLAVARSEDELAGVLGHELTHVERRHTAEAQRPRLLGSILGLPGNVIGMVLPRVGNFVNSPIDTLRALRLARYGREQETESDAVGQRLAARAGYDPAALARVLERMDRVVAQMTGEHAGGSYFDTHPATPDRVAAIERGAAALEVGERSAAARSDDEFVRALDGLVWDEDPARGVFRENLLLHPVLGVAVTFPESWQTVLTAALAGAVGGEGERAVYFRAQALGEGGIGPRVLDVDARMREDGYSPAGGEILEVGGRDMQLVEFSNAGEGRIAMQGIVPFGPVFGEFLAFGPESARAELRDIVLSMRPMTRTERRSIVTKRLRVVVGMPGETLRAIATRASSAVSIGLLAALNDLEPDAPLAEVRLVKVVREEWLF